MAPPFRIFGSSSEKSTGRSVIDLTARTSRLKLNDGYDTADYVDMDVEYGDDGDDEIATPAPGNSKLANARARNGAHSRASPTPREYKCKGSAVTSFGVTVSPGNDVELAGGDFLRIQRIMVNRTTRETLLRGILFRRNCWVDRMLRFAINEICAILTEVDPQVSNPALHDNLVDIPLDSVICIREIVLTNRLFGGDYKMRLFSDLSFRDGLMDSTKAAEDGVLVCRWKRVEYGDVSGSKGHSGALLRLREAESDPGKGIPDAALVYWWRELAPKGGVPAACPPGATYDLTMEDDEPRSKRDGKRPRRDRPTDDKADADVFSTFRKIYKTTTVEDIVVDAKGNTTKHKERSESLSTFRRSVSGPQTGTKRNFNDDNQPSALDALVSEERTHFDVCSGAGGMATGVRQTRSKVKFLLDMDEDACNTVRLAFPEAKVLHMKLDELFHSAVHQQRSYKVVTVHISYPCKTYSGAHTRPGKNDVQNEDTAASVEDILKKTRGKVVTFEQTSHMVVFSKNRDVWRRLIRELTFNSYSLRWKVADCTEHGSPSKRDRLIILGACPGHPLPDFPPPRPGRKTTIADVLAQKPHHRNLDAHMLQYTRKTAAPYDANKTLEYTITCDGGAGDTHPSGQRSFDQQELAMLAGFPRWRKFATACMTKLRELIGNAVPAGLAKDVYTMVHEGLDEGEAEMVAWLMGGSTVVKEEAKKEVKREVKKEVIVLDDDVIIIDDDDDDDDVIVID